jgi:hypothetical protein
MIIGVKMNANRRITKIAMPIHAPDVPALDSDVCSGSSFVSLAY